MRLRSRKHPGRKIMAAHIFLGICGAGLLLIAIVLLQLLREAWKGRRGSLPGDLGSPAGGKMPRGDGNPGIPDPVVVSRRQVLQA